MHAARCLRALLLATVLAGVTLALAPTAMACVLQMTLDRPSYGPGTPAVITGYASGPQSETATRVTLTWGDGGPLLGEASIAPDQSFSFSFTVAADMRSGDHAIYARAFNAAGEMISPLPGSVLLKVNAPATPGTDPTETPATTPKPKPAEAKAEPRATSKDAPVPQTQSAPSAAQTPPATVAAPVTAAEERTISAPLPTETAVRARVSARTAAPPVARVQEPSLASQLDFAARPVESSDEAASSGAGDSSGTAPVLLFALAILGLALGAVGARLVLGRRSSAAPAVTADAGDSVEAELQEMIAEERARTDRVADRP